MEKTKSSTSKQKCVPQWVNSNGKLSMTWCENHADPCHCCVATKTMELPKTLSKICR